MNKLVLFPLTATNAPAVDKGSDWREYEGEAKTPTIGIMIPKGVFVIDVDTYKGATVGDLEVETGCSFNWEEAALQQTKRGGLHYAFCVPKDCDLPNATNLLDVKGIDSRSSHKGYIATGKNYTDLTMIGVLETLSNPDILPQLPPEFLALIETDGNNTKQHEATGDLLSLVVNQPLDVTDDEVEIYLGKLTDDQAEDQDQWLRVGMALYHQYAGGEKGWELFDEFSKRSPSNYDERKNRARWDSFGKRSTSNPITFASVITMAGGRQAVDIEKAKGLAERIATVDNRKELIELFREAATLNLDTVNEVVLLKAFKKAFKVVTNESVTDNDVRRMIRRSRPRKVATYHEDYVFMTQTAEYVDRKTKARMKREAFNVSHNRDTPPDGDGNPQAASTYVDGIIETVHGGMYAPQFAEVFEYDEHLYLNTFRPNKVERVDYTKGTTVDVVKRHIAHLLSDPKEQALVVDYLAHNVQFAGKKIHWAIILQGVQGDGKSLFAEMMNHVLGASNCTSINVDTLDEKFTPWAEGNQMVFIEELKLDNFKKYETLNKLKPYITNPTVSVRRMRTDVYEAINTANYFALTNFKDALPIDENDRRYCVLFSRWQTKDALRRFMDENPDYYPNLYGAIREGVGEILDWLLRHKITPSFLKATTAPDTDAKSKMVDISKSDGFLIVEDAIAEFEKDDINDQVVNITELQRLVAFDPDFMNKFPKAAALKNVLVDMGYHYIGRYKNRERKNQTLYAKDDRKNPLDFRTDD